MGQLKKTKVGALALASIAALFALALASGQALAVDKGKRGQVKAEQADDWLSPVATANDPWTGCYLSLGLGYVSQSTEIAGPVSFDAKDVTYSIGGGCDYRFKGTKLLVGLYGDYTFTNASSILADIDRAWFLGARGGVLMSDSLLAYLAVGYTSLDGSAPIALPFSADYEGLTLGAGLEAMLTKHWSLKAEYRNVDLGRDVGGVFEHSQHEFKAWLSYRF